MKHVLWLGLLWASARAGEVAAQPPTLQVQFANVTEQVALTEPCLGCKASLRTATQGYAPEEPSPPVPAARSRALPKKPDYGIGDSWKFGKRTLSVRLTPTPEECAPLVSLTF